MILFNMTGVCVLSFHLFRTPVYIFPEFVGASVGVGHTGGRSQLQTFFICCVCCGNNTQHTMLNCCALYSLFVYLVTDVSNN